MSTYRSRAAFTVIEVLVVITILGLLMAILIPAIQAARESARRMECLSRLSQLGGALHNFEAAYGHFPSARWGFRAPQGGNEMYSPHAHLLPYVDQAAIYNRINFRDGGTFSVDPIPLGIADQKVAVFLCPSDPVDFGCNFRFCTGSGAYFWHFTDPTRRNGAFTQLETHRAGEFTDGLSNTIAASEKVKSDGEQAVWSTGQFWYSGVADLLGLYPPTDVVIQTCASLNSSPAEFGWHAGDAWLIGAYDFTLYNHAVSPNSPIPDCSIHGGGIPFAGHDAEAGVFAARSFHPGGVNCVLMDGSGRFVSQSVGLGVWWALSTRAGAEAIGEY